MSELIYKQDAIDLVKEVCDAIMSGCDSHYDPETEDKVYNDILEVDAILKCNKEIRIALANLPSAEPELSNDSPKLDNENDDLISREEILKLPQRKGYAVNGWETYIRVSDIKELPSAQQKQRYTKEELKAFRHGIILSSMAKQESQHWHYNKDTATEIEFLERLYEKVGVDMRGE